MEPSSTSLTFGKSNMCQVCGDGPLKTVLALGHQAPVHAHLTKENLHEPEVRFPLNFCSCNKCGLFQLDYIPDPALIFYPGYPYFSGMTTMLIRDFCDLRDSLVQNHGLRAGDMIVDIGSNDGTLLKQFKEKGMKVLGVEPTNVADVAQKNGITTIKKFFNSDVAKEIVEKYGRAKVVTATNMFAHVNDPLSLARNIESLLSEDGIFVSESQYLGDTLGKLELDTIYHEHLRYYSFKPLQKLLSLVGLTVIDAERIGAAGGSIRVYAQRGGRSESDRVAKLISFEESSDVYKEETLISFANRAIKAKFKLLEMIVGLKQQGKRIVGIGAPGRSNTLLQFMNIDSTMLDYAVEKKGSPKIGLYTPSTHIPIVDEDILYTDQPDYGLLLSWHIGDELIKKLKERGFRGKFIVPLPEAKILD